MSTRTHTHAASTPLAHPAASPLPSIALVSPPSLLPSLARSPSPYSSHRACRRDTQLTRTRTHRHSAPSLAHSPADPLFFSAALLASSAHPSSPAPAHIGACDRTSRTRRFEAAPSSSPSPACATRPPCPRSETLRPASSTSPRPSHLQSAQPEAPRQLPLLLNLPPTHTPQDGLRRIERRPARGRLDRKSVV